MIRPQLLLLLSSLVPGGAAVDACGAGFVACPPGSASAGVCVPSVSPWCALAPYKNPYALLPSRVSDLTSRLTLQQKVNLMQTTPLGGDSAVPSLGIPQSTMGECLHGYVSRTPSTLFPQSTTLAASFDPALLEGVARAIGIEGRAWRNAWTAAGNASAPPPSLSCFSPQINIVRDPRWGRAQETYGEDPFLTAALAAAYVRGLQGGGATEAAALATSSASSLAAASGPGPYLLAAATAKHFIAYQGASSRGTASPTEVFLSWRDQIDTYEVSWRSVAAAGSAGVMCAYSSLCHDDTNTTCALPPPAGYGRSHGVPMCADPEMLNGWLRAGGGGGGGGANGSSSDADLPSVAWDGLVTGDCGAVQFIQTDHLWAADQAHAAADALAAGTDFDCSISVGEGFAALVNATALGLISEAQVDVALGRLFAVDMRLGYYDPPEMVPYASIPMSVVNSAEHRGLAAAAARAGLVLLKNARGGNGGGVLPLAQSDFAARGSLLVTGPNAQLFAVGNYNTQTDLNVTALAGLRAYAPGASFAPGCANVSSNDTSLIAAAVDAAAAAVAVVAVMGLDETQEYEDNTRASLGLPGAQDALLQALCATGTPVILVLISGSPVVPAPPSLACVAAVIWAGYGGEEAGTALADAVFGVYNPGGRLPFTFFTSVDDLPPYLNMSMVGLPFGRTYRYYQGGPEPVWRFGVGLSYSAFAVTGLQVGVVAAAVNAAPPPASFAMCDSISVTVNVSNVGPRDGDTVLQAYVRLLGAPLTTPLLTLAGFTRVSLGAAAGAAPVAFTLPPRSFSIVNGTDRSWWQYPIAAVGIFVGEGPPSEADWEGPTAVVMALTGSAGPLARCGPGA